MSSAYVDRVSPHAILDEDGLDAVAVRACAGGEPRALERLYVRHAPACTRLARGVLRDAALAEDAVQEAFLDLWRAAARFDPTRRNVSSWLLMLTHRRAVDRVRIEQRQRCLSLPADVDVVDTAPGPEQACLRMLEASALHAGLAGLPPLQLEALVLAYWQGRSQSQVALLTRAPLGTVKARMRTGLRSLHTSLDELL